MTTTLMMVASIKGVWREADVQMYPCEEQCSVDSKNFERFKMKTWKILKDGVEVARISPEIDHRGFYCLTGELKKLVNDLYSYYPAQKKDHESDFGILLGDGSYLKAELVKEHKFKAGDIIVNSLNKKFQVYKTITDNPLHDIIITKVPDDYLNAAWETHSKDFKLWEKPKETLESWFKAQNFGDEFHLFVGELLIRLHYVNHENPEERIALCDMFSNLGIDRQKRIIEKYIKLYK